MAASSREGPLLSTRRLEPMQAAIVIAAIRAAMGAISGFCMSDLLGGGSRATVSLVLNAPRDEEDDDDDEQDAEPATRKVAPARAMRPNRKHAEQKKHQENQKY